MFRTSTQENTMNIRFLLTPFVAAFLTLTATLHAQVPQLINYQGRVAVGTVNFNGTGAFRFALVDTAGTTTYWSNSPDTAPANGVPDSAVTLTVTKGLYSVLLGDTTLTNMMAIPYSVFANADVRLRVWFNDGTNGSQLLTPDQRIVAVGYAIMSATVRDGAITAEKIANGAVGTAQIGTGAVQAGNIATGAVGSSQLAADAVQAGNIAAGAVGTSQIANGTITTAKMAKPVRSGSIPSSSISMDSTGGSFVVNFAQELSATPIVTLSLQTAPASPAATATVFLTDRTTTQFSATVSGTGLGAAPATPNTTGSVGAYTSLVVVNGNPAISYYDFTNQNLKYVRATNAGGATWGGPVTVSGIGTSVGGFTSLAVVNGNPAISYYDATSFDLKYVRALDANGTFWGTPVTVNSTGSVGAYTSLAVVNGRPAISYRDSTNGDLNYVQASDANGATWFSIDTVIVDSTGDVGLYTSLAVVDGRPAISYYDATNGDLNYVRATTANGTTWGTPVTLDSTGDVGQYTSLAVINGNPAISYYDDTANALKYVRATTISGTLNTDWGTPLYLDGTGNVGRYTSLMVVNGNPAISYYDSTNTNLKYVRATTASGTLMVDWGKPVIIDNAGDVGQYTSLAVINGNPAISYYDFDNGDLKYVRATDLDGTTWPSEFTIHWIAIEP
jgi:hypothetical protein